MVVNENSGNNTINKTHEEIREEGEEAGEAEATDETNTADTTGQNSVEDNKKLSEVTMAEQIRKTFNLTLKIPRILQGLHTNQFFFIQVSDHFYETNYPTLISTIADKKFGRFAGFKKGRFFVEKVVEKGGMSGWETEVTLNPIPPSLALYSQKQKAAQKALMTAVKDISGAGTGGTGNGNVNSSDLIGIGNELASKYDYCMGAGSESYTTMKEKGCGSCFAWSGALYTELTAKGYECRVIQYSTSAAGNHRSVQINVNGNWEDFPYRSTNIPKMARSTDSKPGMFVIDDATLQSIL